MKIFTNLISYLFNPNPGRIFSYYVILIIVAVGLLAFSIFLRLHLKKYKEDKAFKRLFRGFPKKLQIIALLLIAYLFFRYYTVGFISMRILLYLILAGAAWILYRMAYSYFKKYPPAKKEHERQMAMNKYLPGRGK